jgi:TrbL/VirB6 plasmid conjugal transfer protein
MQTATVRRMLHRVALGIGLLFVVWVTLASMPRTAQADAFCDAGNVPKAGQPCEGWGAPPVPGTQGTICKLEEYDASGAATIAPEAATCYPPGVPPPANSFPCQVLTGPGTWGIGSCVNSIPGPPPPGTSPPPGASPPPAVPPAPVHTPPPLPPIVTEASCTHSPPSIWYDLDAPDSAGTATTWAAPNEGQWMVVRDQPVNSLAPSWMLPAQNFASMTFKTLFVFEIFMIGLQGILFRDDLAHFFSSFAFKTFLATFFIYLTANAPTILPAVEKSFRIAGQDIAAGSGGPGGEPQSGKIGLLNMYKQADDAAELFFCAAMASHIDDLFSGLEYGSFTNGALAVGTANIGQVINAAIGHITFEFIVQALGMLVIAGAGIMALSLSLYTVESYIVMFAGAFFLGLSSFRYTLPYTMGYLNYTAAVGVKLFTYWILIAIESVALMPILQRAGIGLINAASIQYGEQPGRAGQEMYLLSASVDVAQILGMAALTWFLPGIVARFICGRSVTDTVMQVSRIASSLKSREPVAVGTTNAVFSTPVSSPFLEQRAITSASQTDAVSAETRIAYDAAAPSSYAIRPVLSAVPSALPPIVEKSMGKPTKLKREPKSMNEQPVQASVKDGVDPFAAKLKPVVVSTRGIMLAKRRHSSAPKRQDADHDFQHD